MRGKRGRSKEREREREEEREEERDTFSCDLVKESQLWVECAWFVMVKRPRFCAARRSS